MSTWDSSKSRGRSNFCWWKVRWIQLWMRGCIGANLFLWIWISYVIPTWQLLSPLQQATQRHQRPCPHLHHGQTDFIASGEQPAPASTCCARVFYPPVSTDLRTISHASYYLLFRMHAMYPILNPIELYEINFKIKTKIVFLVLVILTFHSHPAWWQFPPTSSCSKIGGSADDARPKACDTYTQTEIRVIFQKRCYNVHVHITHVVCVCSNGCVNDVTLWMRRNMLLQREVDTYTTHVELLRSHASAALGYGWTLTSEVRDWSSITCRPWKVR